MKKIINGIVVFLGILFLMYSCVPSRQFQELKTENQACINERDILKAQNKEYTEKITEMEAEVKRMAKEISALQTDTTVMGVSLRKITKQYDKINQLNEDLLTKTKEQMVKSETESKSLLSEVQRMHIDLQKREDKLKEAERALETKKSDLELLQKTVADKTQALEQKTAQLEKTSAELMELQKMLKAKDSVVSALKAKVTDALIGFENQGLTIQQKNGKVYVSLEEKLLFKSGKWDVDPKGIEALKKLAKVLETNTDINVMIEGHTDNVPYNGKGEIQDNWDLSVKRATSIVRILLANSKIDAKRLMVAGRGEFMPIDAANTPEARTKNRRTEIILTPKLDELFKILDAQ